MGDLSRRRGKIMGMEAKGNAVVVNAEVPLAEMFGYATAIRSLSKGRAAYSMEPLAFEPVPANIVETIMDQRKDRAAART
jgi:elongation factor G